MTKPADAAREPAIDIRFGEVGLLQLRIHTTDPVAILDALSGRVATAPQFFTRTAVCLDLSALASAPEAGEIRTVIETVRSAGMVCVGLAHGAPAVEALSSALELPVLSSFRPQSKPVPVVQPVVQPAAQPVEAPPEPGVPALMHHHPVRSGQRIYARHRDLVVTTTVGAGAEVIADGCVHIYGCLRGRAMAGARGDLTARVFCQEFHAELVSIAGVFRVFETLPADLVGQPVQAWLDGDDLHFARIGG